jgi:uncharacterized protein (TIGR03437 family)
VQSPAGSNGSEPGDEAAEWRFLGPKPTGPPFVATSGRVTALAVDPRDSLTVYLGAAGGGIWKTTDGGANWGPLADDAPSLVIGSLALDPSNPDVIYAGTGEANACETCYAGAGILKSTDGGATWRQLPGPFIDALGRGARVAALAVHPSNGEIVLAAVYFVNARGLPGIFRSADGGETWTPVLNEQQGTAVLFDRWDPDTAYAAVFGTGVFKSIDAGQTWHKSNGADENALPAGKAGRIELVLAESTAGMLLATLADAGPDSQGGSLGIFRTLDGGRNWTRLNGAPDHCHPLCSYDNVLAVHPANASVLYAGGVNLYRSLDWGETWSTVNRGAGTVFVHSDQHALAFARDGSALYVGNDGGVYSTAEPAAPALAWSNRNLTLGITPLHAGLSLHPSDAAIAYAGAAGNGAQKYAGAEQWETVACRDGGWTFVDPGQPSIVYASCQRTEIRKSFNAGASWSAAMTGINRDDRVRLVPPLAADPSNPSRLYFGTFRVYQSTDGAGAWAAISGDLAGDPHVVSAIAVAPSDGNVLYAGTTNGRVQITANAAEGTEAFWADSSAGLPERAITQIVVDPENPYAAYATAGGYSGVADELGHLFRTTRLGEGWSDASGNLPNVPVNDLVVDPDLEGTLYVATDIGVFRSGDGGKQWSPLGRGLPRTVVQGLKLHRPTRRLRAATYGRGMWEIEVRLPEERNPAPGVLALAPVQADPGARPLNLTVTGVAFVPGAVVRWNGQDRPTTFVSDTEVKAELAAEDLAEATLARVTVVNPAPGGGRSNHMYFPVAYQSSLNAEGAVNAASFSPRPVAVGSLATVFGKNLAFAAAAAPYVPLPLLLDRTVLRLAYQNAPLVFVSPDQITFQVPWELEGLEAAIVQPTIGGVPGAIQSMRLAVFSPGIFTLTETGSGQGSVTIAGTGHTAAPVGAYPSARPAARGEVISIYCTGLGPVTNRPASGAPAPADPLAVVLNQPNVLFGDIPASSVFAVMAPGLVGMYQVNAEIPADAPTGDAVPLTITVGGMRSNEVTIAVE